MLIVCPTCSTSYQIQLAALGAAGRPVRCAQCKNTWFATADSAIEEAVLLPAAAGDRDPAPSRPQQRAGGDFADDTTRDVTVYGAPPPDGGARAEAEHAVAIADAPPLVPRDQTEVEAAVVKFEPGVPEDTETIAARRARQAYVDRKGQRSLLQRIASLPVLIMALLAILAAALHWRVALVRHFPQTASLFATIGMPVNLRGLTFQDVKSTGEFHDGVMVLAIEGVVVNLTRHTLEVPRLRFALRNSTGHEVYAWTALPSKTQLGSGDGLPFRARLASPPPDGRDVIVRFFNRRDVGAGPQ